MLLNAMLSMLNMFVEGEAVSPLFHAIRIILLVLIVMCALFMIFVVLIQPGNSSGIGAIGGTSETFLGKNKSKTREGRMKRMTVFVAIALTVFSIAFAIVSLNPF